MKQYRTLNALIIAGLLLSPSMTALATDAKQSNALTFEDIFNLQAQSYNVIEEAPAQPTDPKKITKLALKPLSDNKKRSLTYNALVKHSAHKTNSAVFADKNFYKKMDILHGEASSSSLFATIDRTQTVFGQATLARMLCQMTNDVALLKNRQAIIQALISDEELFNTLDRSMQTIKANEASFLSYWEEEDPAHAELYKQVYYTSGPLKGLNTSTTGLEVKTRTGNALTILGILSTPISFISMGVSSIYLQKSALSYAKKSCEKELNNPNLSFHARRHFESSLSEIQAIAADLPESFSASVYKSYKALADGAVEIKNFFSNGKASSNAKIALGAALTAWLAWEVYKGYGHYTSAALKAHTAKQLQTRLIEVAAYSRELENLYITLENSNLRPAGFEHLKNVVCASDVHSADFNALVSKLNCNTFNPSASVFSVTGRVLSAHTALNETKHEFIPAFEFIGELDTYLSMAKLYKEFASKRVHISFAEFVEQDKPYLHATNFWNPFVNPEYVVCNDVTLGAQGLPNNIILTGPNTGGKSTVIKGLILNVLLAQTFGMAWADTLVMTPFTNINCYLNINDDISAGTSLFKAEVLRAKDLINAVRALEGKQFSFTIMDEVFSGTSPKEGEEAAYRFMEEIGAFNNSMVILATHFPLITELPDKQPHAFKNYRVAVTKDANGKIVRHYKLEDGKTFMNIAMDLLKEEGIFLNNN